MDDHLFSQAYTPILLSPSYVQNKKKKSFYSLTGFFVFVFWAMYVFVVEV